MGTGVLFHLSPLLRHVSMPKNQYSLQNSDGNCDLESHSLFDDDDNRENFALFYEYLHVIFFSTLVLTLIGYQ